MPYRLVLTKNGPSEEVTAVPEGWVVEGHLYWPRSLKKNEIESLRSNENSIPEKSWKKFKCRVKLGDISSFQEALHLEELYSKFQDTEDEEMYLNERKNKKKQTTCYNQLLDLNSNFEINKNNIEEVNIKTDKNNIEEVNIKTDKNNQIKTKNVATDEVQALSSDYQDNIQISLQNVEDTSTITDETLSLKTSELLKIIQENNSLHTENTALKEELLRSVEFQNETRKNFAIMQTQLDKIIEIVQNKNQSRSSVLIENDGPSTDNDKMILCNINFPIDSKELLDELEYKLLEKDVMTYLIRKFSETCGTSGIARISKVGLTLMKRIIKDELLNQFTWKGIKGSTKMAFVQYVKIRELFYKVAHLADKSCSFSDSDSFIQNSAIKHSGQRLKRQIVSSDSKINAKRTKKETNVIENNSSKTQDAEIIDEIEMNEENCNSENYCGFKNNQERTDENCRDVNNENKDSLITEKDKDLRDVNKEKKDSLKTEKDENFRDVNDENKDTENTKKKRGFNKKNEADDLQKITILSDVKIRNKAEDIKNVKKMANISSTNASAIFDNLINFSP